MCVRVCVFTVRVYASMSVHAYMFVHICASVCMRNACVLCVCALHYMVQTIASLRAELDAFRQDNSSLKATVTSMGDKVTHTPNTHTTFTHTLYSHTLHSHTQDAFTYTRCIHIRCIHTHCIHINCIHTHIVHAHIAFTHNVCTHSHRPRAHALRRN